MKRTTSLGKSHTTINTFTGRPVCLKCSYVGCGGETIRHLSFHLWLFKERHLKVIRKFKARLAALDYSKIEDIELDDIHMNDYPDFCDAFVCRATYKGREMNEKELDKLNEDRDFVYECVLERIY